MSDLISRKALIAEYDRVHVGPPGGARKLIEDAPEVKPGVAVEIKIDNDALQGMVDEAVEEIKAELFGNQAPTIEPRTKAKWIKPTGMMPPEHAGHWECSNCGFWAMRDWLRPRVVLTNFCPNCGSYNGENVEQPDKKEE